MARTTASESSKTGFTLLNLALNTATIGSLSDAGQDGTHGLDQEDTNVCRGKFESGLDNVVAIRITHELLEFLLMHHFLDHDSFSVHVSAANTLLDNVGAELLLGKLSDVSAKAETERVSEGHIVQVENVLDNIVSKRVLDELEAVCSNLAYKLDLLKARGMVNAALKNTASVTVRTNGNTVFADSIEDELSVLSLEMVEALLNHMIAVKVLNESDHIATQSVDDHLNL